MLRLYLVFIFRNTSFLMNVRQNKLYSFLLKGYLAGNVRLEIYCYIQYIVEWWAHSYFLFPILFFFYNFGLFIRWIPKTNLYLVKTFLIFYVLCLFMTFLNFMLTLALNKYCLLDISLNLRSLNCLHKLVKLFMIFPCKYSLFVRFIKSSCSMSPLRLIFLINFSLSPLLSK